MAASSPASSPRLPSPPPIAEDQIGPTSPGVSLFEDHAKFPGANSVDTGAARRIRPGTKSEDMGGGPPLVDLQDIDSAFQLTEYLKSLHWHHSHCPDSDSIQPITAYTAKRLSTPPPNTSKDIWLYELGRFLIQGTNAIIVNLFADDPPCSAQTCPEMRASEWQYLCAVHDPPKSCAAIDYCCHTLDWAATTLTQSKIFPSRLGLGSGSGNMMGGDKVLQQQMKEIKNIFRRVYRIFAHAWFQHREMFWRVESKTGLYVFFKTVCDEYGIIESENYTIPAEAEGLEPELPPQKEDIQAPSLLKRDQDVGLGVSGASPEKKQETYSLGDTTKRHRHTLSDYSTGVNAPIQEEAEEEETAPPEKPPLDRQGTTLKEEGVTEEQSPGTPEEPAADEPVPGIARSNTIKPPKEVEEESEKGDETVIETPPSSETSEQGEESTASQDATTTMTTDTIENTAATTTAPATATTEGQDDNQASEQ